MGRPPLGVGTPGKIRLYRTRSGWRAEAKFRDWDGETRLVKRVGATKRDAEQNLKDALRDRQQRASTDLTRHSTFVQAGELWLAEVKVCERGTTYDRYRSRLHGRLVPALGKLRIHEVTTGVCDRFLRSLTAPKNEGGAGLAPQTARGYKAALSAIMRYCVRMDAIQRNPVAEVSDIRGRGKRSRALTPHERADILIKLDSDPAAVDADLPDLIRYLLGTGVRMGEALGLRWFRVDLDAGIVVHAETLARETGRGLLLHDPKTAAGIRILKLPEFVLLLLRARWPGPEFGGSPVFPDKLGGWRDPVNTARKIRKWREPAGYGWFTSHVCRHTAITICDQAGLRPREISGHHGHADPSFTQRVYMDLTQQSGAVAEALDRAYRTSAS